ncbi:MAG: hypothetical protein ACI97A_004236 [Planctomycetota bacterium]|jgi:hypothetical protein
MRATLTIFATLMFLVHLQGTSLAYQQQLAPEPSSIERARQKVLDRGSYQTQLPTGNPKTPESKARDFSWLEGLGPFGSVLAWALIVFAVGFVVVLIVREFSSRSSVRRRRKIGLRPKEMIRGSDFSIDMADIRTLAAESRFSEAIHALLLRTVHELCRLADIDILPSKTSREITQEIPLEEHPRRDLSALVTATEISHFGLEEASVDDYETCMAHFESFVQAVGGNSL